MQVAAPVIARSTPAPAALSNGTAPKQAFHAVLSQTAASANKPALTPKDPASRDTREPGKSHSNKQQPSPAAPASHTATAPITPEAPTIPAPSTISAGGQQLPTAPIPPPPELLPLAISAQPEVLSAQPGDNANLAGRNAPASLLSATSPNASATASTLPPASAPNLGPASTSPNPQPPAADAKATTAEAIAPPQPSDKSAKLDQPSATPNPAHTTSSDTNTANPTPEQGSPAPLVASAPDAPSPLTLPIPPTVLPDPLPSNKPTSSAAPSPKGTAPGTSDGADVGRAGAKRDPKSVPTTKPSFSTNISDTADANASSINPQHDLTPAVHGAAAPQPQVHFINPQASAQPALINADAPKPLHTSADPSTPAAALSQPTTPSDAQAAPTINTAKLIQTMTESEMRVGMRSPDFGNISIRTSLAHQGLSAQISLDHNGLRQALSAHLPAMEAKLGEEYGVKANVEVMSGNSSFSGNTDRDQHGRQPGRQTSSSLPSLTSGALPQTSAPTLIPAALLNTSRLDIRI